MFDQINDFLHDIIGYVWFILLAVVGGTLNYISRVKRDPELSFSLIELLGEWFAAGFVGLMTAYVCAYMEMGFPLTAALCGISGHMAGRIVYIIDVRGQSIIERIVDKWLR